MTLKISQDSLNKLTGKMSRIAQKAPAHTWPFIVELLTNYGQTIISAMGSLDGFGGDAKITLRGVGMYEKSEVSRWPALSPYTMAKKLGYSSTSQGDLVNIYDAFAASVRIWQYTGASYQAVAAAVQNVKAGGHFVGIESSPYAAVVELGDPSLRIPKRPLFTVLNDMLVIYIRRELRSKDSKLSTRIRGEFTQFALDSGWGR